MSHPGVEGGPLHPLFPQEVQRPDSEGPVQTPPSVIRQGRHRAEVAAPGPGMVVLIELAIGAGDSPGDQLLLTLPYHSRRSRTDPL